MGGICGFSVGKWVSVRLTNNYTYVGMIHAVTHFPHEKEMILTSANAANGEYYPIQIYDGSLQLIEPSVPPAHILIRAENISSATILESNRQYIEADSVKGVGRGVTSREENTTKPRFDPKGQCQ